MLLAVALGSINDAAAQPAAARWCASCHGAQGEGGSTGAPALAGQPREYLLRQLEAYADGRRQHAIMTPLSKGLQAAEREALATYYAGLVPRAPPPQLGANAIDLRRTNR